MKEVKEQFMQVSSADGELKIDADSVGAEELLSVAREAGISGRRIVLAYTDRKERDLLKRIAVAGKGNVLFDLR